MTTVALSNKENNVQCILIEQNTINGEQQTDINTKEFHKNQMIVDIKPKAGRN